MAGPLDGVRVVDCSVGMAGAIATMMLADYGAHVVKVEPPGGDPLRQWESYRTWFRGKHSIVLDPAVPSDHEALRGLVAGADILVESFDDPEQSAEIFGNDLLERHPGLVHCRVTGYGDEGPWAGRPGADCLVSAHLGVCVQAMGATPDHPRFLGFPMASFGASYLIELGCVSALIARQRTGRGQRVDVSLLDGLLLLSTFGVAFLRVDKSGSGGGAGGEHSRISRGRQRSIVATYQGSDGEYFSVHTGAPGAFARTMKIVGLHDQISPAQGHNELGDVLTEEDGKLIDETFPEILRSKPRDHWIETLRAAEVCAIPVLKAGEAFADPQVRHNGLIIEQDHPDVGTLAHVGPPMAMSKTPPEPGRRAPQLDEDRAEVLASIGTTWAPLVVEEVSGGAPFTNGPLTGVRIVDAGNYFAGPYGSRVLRDLGAEVIKVEGTTGDPLRPVLGVFQAANRGKHTIAIDLKNEDGRAVFFELVSKADVVCQNFRPGAADRIGIGYEQVVARKPDLVYAYNPGWGTDGPSALLQSFAPMMQGLSGMYFKVGGEGNTPTRTLTSEDYHDALLSALAVVMALYHRSRTGEGQLVVTPQINSALFAVSDTICRTDGSLYSALICDHELNGWGDPLYRHYATSDGWISIAVPTDARFAALAAALEAPELVADERFTSVSDRQSNGVVLADLLGHAFSKQSTGEWKRRLDSAGVPAEGVAQKSAMDDLFYRSEHLKSHRIEIERDPLLGRIREVGSRLINFSMTPTATGLRPAPRQGEDTREILAALHHDSDDVDRLIESGAVFEAAPIDDSTKVLMPPPNFDV